MELKLEHYITPVAVNEGLDAGILHKDDDIVKNAVTQVAAYGYFYDSDDTFKILPYVVYQSDIKIADEHVTQAASFLPTPQYMDSFILALEAVKDLKPEYAGQINAIIAKFNDLVSLINDHISVDNLITAIPEIDKNFMDVQVQFLNLHNSDLFCDPNRDYKSESLVAFFKKDSEESQEEYALYRQLGIVEYENDTSIVLNALKLILFNDGIRDKETLDQTFNNSAVHIKLSEDYNNESFTDFKAENDVVSLTATPGNTGELILDDVVLLDSLDPEVLEMLKPQLDKYHIDPKTSILVDIEGMGFIVDLINDQTKMSFRKGESGYLTNYLFSTYGYFGVQFVPVLSAVLLGEGNTGMYISDMQGMTDDEFNALKAHAHAQGDRDKFLHNTQSQEYESRPVLNDAYNNAYNGYAPSYSVTLNDDSTFTLDGWGDDDISTLFGNLANNSETIDVTVNSADGTYSGTLTTTNPDYATLNAEGMEYEEYIVYRNIIESESYMWRPNTVNVTIEHIDSSPETVSLNPSKTYSEQGYIGYYSQPTYDSSTSESESADNYLVDNNHPVDGETIYDFCHDTHVPAE